MVFLYLTGFSWGASSSARSLGGSGMTVVDGMLLELKNVWIHEYKTTKILVSSSPILHAQYEYTICLYSR